jgi:hypothetical protein
LPKVNGQLRIKGVLPFKAEADGLERIEDEYLVDIVVPPSFPRDLPAVTETAGRIPRRFHTNPDRSLCLGSPTRQRLALGHSQTLSTFVEQVLIPYLYGFSFRERHNFLPFGELAHDKEGLIEDFANLFGETEDWSVLEMVRLTGLKKRHANKQPCPCGSGRRVGKCHHLRLNALRNQLGRRWFHDQYSWLQRKGNVTRPR